MDQELNELLRLRREKLETWRGLGVEPFGAAFPETTALGEVRANFEEGRRVRVAGRLVAIRVMGKNVFAHLQDQTGKIQIYAKKDELGEAYAYWKKLDIGDFIGGEGETFITKTGEPTVRLQSLRLLGKSLHPLPSGWHGLSDVEQRYRQRYLDLIANPPAAGVLQQRSEIVREVRRYLEEAGFTEVETPMMQAVAGGAAATPFVTHHNALDIDLYLRIAPELYLKRLLVGGYRQVFEVNRNFRNEGISRKHNPEFTMLEAYWAYADYESMAALVEGMIAQVAEKVIGTLQVGGREATEDTPGREPIDLTPPWPRKAYRDCVREAAGADWFELSPEGRRAKAEELGVDISQVHEDFEVTNQVFEKLVEAKTWNPLFVTHLPKELVPLAKQNVDDPSVVDVYELIIAGQEISPGYSELNDPVIQRERLLAQAGEEVQNLDEDFLAALEYGMPPAGGL
ncbi:MAG: lysine--tRNA ligase, partial [Verrucomicrobiota bacterium]